MDAGVEVAPLPVDAESGSYLGAADNRRWRNNGNALPGFSCCQVSSSSPSSPSIR